eukprot:1750496-Pyramimonas_sp.AAC.2
MTPRGLRAPRARACLTSALGLDTETLYNGPFRPYQAILSLSRGFDSPRRVLLPILYGRRFVERRALLGAHPEAPPRRARARCRLSKRFAEAAVDGFVSGVQGVALLTQYGLPNEVRGVTRDTTVSRPQVARCHEGYSCVTPRVAIRSNLLACEGAPGDARDALDPLRTPSGPPLDPL